MKDRCRQSCKILILLIFLSNGVWAQESQPVSNKQYYDIFFSEETLIVSTEEDALQPGSLRSVFFTAQALRSQDPYKIIKIKFADNVERILLKNPLPEWNQSLITLDCSKTQGRVLIDGSLLSNGSPLEANPTTAFTISGSGNKILSCHLTGFNRAALIINGHRNVLSQNIFGYLPGSFKPSHYNYYEDPSTNKGSAIIIENGASENFIIGNEFIANQKDVIKFAGNAGTQNRISKNIFGENFGLMIQDASNYRAVPPTFEILQKSNNQILIRGNTTAHSMIEFYLLGRNLQHVSPKISEQQINAYGKFEYVIPNPGLQLDKSKVVALVHEANKNTSAFSEAKTLKEFLTTTNAETMPSLTITPTQDTEPTTPIKEKEIEIKEEPETQFDVQDHGTETTDVDVPIVTNVN